MRRLLIVDDERNVHYSFARALEGAFEVVSAHDGHEALALLEHVAVDVVLLDVKLPRLGGLETLERLRERHPELAVIVMTAYGTVDTAIRATALAARDYLLKPIDVPALKKLLNEVLPRGEPAPAAPEQGDEPAMVGRSAAMHELFKLVGRAAAADATVLVTGESGTGKELVARAIHRHSRRKDGPFVAINVAAIPETLLESELFGHERGAFTGADATRPGKFELAHRGTLVLDEIGEMAPALQAKLLRVLQSREVTRLGGSMPLELDVRVVVLTNADLEAKLAAGTFREDLYYRLNVFRIVVPPLRARGDDALLVARHFLARERARSSRTIHAFTAEAEQRIASHSWPGNVRELENVVAQACLKAKGDRITADDLAIASSAARRDDGTPASDPLGAFARAVESLFAAFPGEAFDRIERATIESALAAAQGNQVRAARLLGISRNVIRNRMAKHGVGAVAARAHEAGGSEAK